MRRRLVLILAGGFLAIAAFADAGGQDVPGRHPSKEESYTITSVIELVKPFKVADMNDDFQEAHVLTETRNSSLVVLTYYPLFQPEIGENANWRKDDAGMTEYLKPTPSENWDEAMRKDLLAELRVAKIEPDALTDKQLVEKVSAWAMRRSHSAEAFSIWAVHYVDGKPAVYPELREAFDKQKPGKSWTDERMFGEEALGREMYYNKVRGSCTSSSIYLTTILRALGIPTRMVFCIPPFDPNDKAQAKMFYTYIHHNRIRETVREALDKMHGFDNHIFNEVYVGHHWVRLNYKTLGQPVLDAHYFGLLTHIYTTADMSQVPLAETWGMRYFKYPAGQAEMSSINPYRLISVREEFGAKSRVENPPVLELQAVTIIGLYRIDSPEVPKWAADPKLWEQSKTDFLIATKEWLPGMKNQMRAFQGHVGHEFRLTAANQPDVHVHLNGLDDSAGNGSFQAYGATVAAEDKSKVAAGVVYKLEPVNVSETYRWTVGTNVAGVRLKE